MSTIRVQTTQNVTLEYEVASAGNRVVAAILDNVILIAWVGAVLLLLGWLGADDTPMVIGLVVLAGLPYIFYHLLCEVFLNGQSPGKKACNIKVIRLDGTPPRFGDYLIRWILRIVDTGIMSGLIALVVILANGKGQRLGDMAAGTAVVSTKPRQAAGALAPTLTDAGYVVVFPEASRLADHDVATIRQLLQKGIANGNFVLLHELAVKVKTLTGIQTDLPDEAFLRTVLRDHAHLAAQESPYA
ncbi:putative RDD family membrane protein YckC [Hymenobacter luteus]|uniref:RDD family membrane protein YckC n=2 Tax=Hymenobacter TaxID=89966 RepID=A0ABR6JU96_9BACT|nr:MULTISPECIES: RDD family protein [Hymenobacter]MBB4600396.1 putative RDD family membrane protein YckC [Hymenobacter latericoloratus]MBB6057294.1 putative RDD family membrane protein YckC [Hymenobacter luteus]